MNKILLTGGHAATTAMAVIEELVRCGFGEDIYWIGSKYAIEGKKAKTLESQIFPEMGVKSYSIVSGRLQRKFTLWTIPSLFKVPLGFFHAIWLIIKIRPSVTLSFGGFASFPVVLVSWFFRIPVLVHEQTNAAGLANRISGLFAKKILLARERSKRFFNSRKCEIIGNPVMTQICEIKPKEKLSDPPTILITSGSRGSQIINKVIYEVLEKLLQKYRLIHLTGEADYSMFSSIKNERYEVYSWVEPMKIDGLYKEADVVIARAGANTVSEIIMARRPSILIPIPWSYLNEQRLNAQVAKDFGIARVIEQSDLTPKILLNELDILIANYVKMVANAKAKESFDKNASAKVANCLEEYLK